MNPLFYLDRSTLETYQRCPRKYYWGHAYKGRGLVRQRYGVPLAVGAVVHPGFAALLEGKGIREAVQISLDEFEKIMKGSGLDIPDTDDQFLVAEEQRALIEGMLWASHLVAVPKLLEEFEILETEREEVTPLIEGGDYVWLARADAVMRSREDKDLYVLSLKTTGTWDIRKDKAAMTDTQGISEAFAVEQRYKEPVMGVKMVHLMRGRKSEDKDTGRSITNSPLIRGWKQFGPGGVKYAHSYEWTDPDTGRNRRLGSGWEKMFVPNDYPKGVSGWIRDMAEGLIQPEAGLVLEKQVVMPVPYFRQKEDLASWTDQTLSQAIVIEAKKERLAKYDSLDVLYPQYRHSCTYPGDCQFIDMCYGASHVRDNPLVNGFTWRKANHPIEETVLPPLEGQ